MTRRTEMGLGALRVVVLTGRHADRSRAVGSRAGTAAAVLVHVEAVLARRQALQIRDKLGSGIGAADQDEADRLVRRLKRDQVHFGPGALGPGPR